MDKGMQKAAATAFPRQTLARVLHSPPRVSCG